MKAENVLDGSMTYYRNRFLNGYVQPEYGGQGRWRYPEIVSVISFGINGLIG